jgi:lipoate---protein ligase
MRYLDLTFSTPEENLALDEALLDEAEQSTAPQETLRIWQPSRLAVIIGRSSRAGDEVHADACREMQVPILRRTSGGAAVVIGPGCLMYSVVLSYRLRPALRMLDRAHQLVLDTLVGALRPSVPQVHREGTSDLAIGDKKVSGNSVRVKHEHLLYHGTLLYDFPLHLVERLLAMPARQPGYRDRREHGAFLANLPLDEVTIRRAVRMAWNAEEPSSEWPGGAIARLVAERYGRESWNLGL